MTAMTSDATALSLMHLVEMGACTRHALQHDYVPRLIDYCVGRDDVHRAVSAFPFISIDLVHIAKPGCDVGVNVERRRPRDLAAPAPAPLVLRFERLNLDTVTTTTGAADNADALRTLVDHLVRAAAVSAFVRADFDAVAGVYHQGLGAFHVTNTLHAELATFETWLRAHAYVADEPIDMRACVRGLCGLLLALDSEHREVRAALAVRPDVTLHVCLALLPWLERAEVRALHAQTVAQWAPANMRCTEPLYDAYSPLRAVQQAAQHDRVALIRFTAQAAFNGDGPVLGALGDLADAARAILLRSTLQVGRLAGFCTLAHDDAAAAAAGEPLHGVPYQDATLVVPLLPDDFLQLPAAAPAAAIPAPAASAPPPVLNVDALKRAFPDASSARPVPVQEDKGPPLTDDDIDALYRGLNETPPPPTLVEKKTKPNQVLMLIDLNDLVPDDPPPAAEALPTAHGGAGGDPVAKLRQHMANEIVYRSRHDDTLQKRDRRAMRRIAQAEELVKVPGILTRGSDDSHFVRQTLHDFATDDTLSATYRDRAHALLTKYFPGKRLAGAESPAPPPAPKRPRYDTVPAPACSTPPPPALPAADDDDAAPRRLSIDGGAPLSSPTRGGGGGLNMSFLEDPAAAPLLSDTSLLGFDPLQSMMY